MTTPRTLRIVPRVWLGVLAYLLYLAVFYGVWIVNGIDYTHIGDNEDTLWKWYVAPTLAGAVVISVIVSVYGWWRPDLFEDRKRMAPWLWVFPACSPHSRSATCSSTTPLTSRRQCGCC